MRRIATALCAAGALAAFALPGSASAAFGPLGAFGGSGSGNGQFNGPRGIAVTGATAYVADTGNNRVEYFSPSGAFQGVLSGGPAAPTDVDARSGDVVAAGPGGVTHWTAGGLLPLSWKPPGTSYGAAFDSANLIWVSDAQGGVVRRYDGIGNLQTTIGSPGTGPGQLLTPQGITTDASAVYVADPGNGKVVKYTATGFKEFAMPTYRIVANGTTISGRVEPHDVAVDAAGRVFVPDANPNSNLVAVFGPGGDLQQLLGSPISDPSSPCPLRAPMGISSSPSGAMYVASTGENAIRIFSESAGSCPAPNFGTDPAAGGTTNFGNGGNAGQNAKGKKGKGQPSIKLVGFPHHCARKNFQFEIRLDDDVEIRVMDLFVNGRRVARQKPGQTSWNVKVKMPVTNVRRQLPKGTRVKVTIEVKAKDASGRKNGLARAFKICG